MFNDANSQIGAYGNLVVEDKSILYQESNVEDDKSYVSYEKNPFNRVRKSSNVSKIGKNPITKGEYFTINENNNYNKYEGKNRELYGENEIILEVNEYYKDNLINHEVTNNIIEKAKKINDNFNTVNSSAKKNNDYLSNRYNIPKNVNDEFFNSSNFLKIMSGNKSGKLPPKLFQKNISLQEFNLNEEITNKTVNDISELNEELEDYFNILPDNSLMNISTFTNNIKVKDKFQVPKIDKEVKDIQFHINNFEKEFKNNNDFKNPFLPNESSRLDKTYLNKKTDNNNKHQNYSFTIKNAINLEVHQDTYLNEFDNTILPTNIINTDNLNTIIYTDEVKLKLPKADEIQDSFFPEESFNYIKTPLEIEIKETKNLSIPIETELVMAEKPKDLIIKEEQKSILEKIEQIEEPDKIQESYLEETFFEEDKTKYQEYQPIETKEGDNKLFSSISFKKDKISLTDLFGKNLINNWAEVSKKKLDKIKNGIIKDEYFSNAFCDEESKIDFSHQALNRNFIQMLDIYNFNIKHILEDCDKKDFLNINDLFRIEEIPSSYLKVVNGKTILIDPKYDWNNNNDFFEEKRTFLEKLCKRQTKTTFNKISYLYDCEVLKQKYYICNENVHPKNEYNRDDKILNGQVTEVFGKSQILKNIIDNSKIKEDDKNNRINDLNLLGDDDSKMFLWRESLCDGNSFYRMFIFSYFEHLIFTKNLELLSKIFVQIYKVYQNLYMINESKKLDNEKYIFNNIKLKNVLMSFNFIINYMRIGDFTNAYKIMINSFNMEDSSFDKITIGYLRLYILDYIKKIETIEKDLKKQEIKELIIRDKIFKNFTFQYIEPEQIILEIAANIFCINIELLYIDGSINNSDNKSFKFSKECFKCESNKNLPTINLYYNLNHFCKYYTAKDYLVNQIILKYYVSKIKDIVFDDSATNCNICQKNENNKKVYFKNQMICACVDCIRNNSNSIIISRFNNFQKDYFISREYYCRALNIHDQIIINDFLYIQLFKNNIWNELKNKIKSHCCKCNKPSDNLFLTKMNLNYCKDCMIEMINKYTNNHLVLNDFEKRQMMKKNPELPSIFDYEESINLLDLNTNERIDSANQRLKEYYENSCCECFEKRTISNDQSKQNPFIKFDNVEIYDKNTKELDTSIIYTHIICANCIENNKIEFNKKSKEGKTDSISNSKNEKGNSEKSKNPKKPNNFIEVEFFCGICNENHFTIFKIDENSRTDKKYCCRGCSIF